MRKVEHIIWDWNGTILDDAWLCVEILNDMLAKRKLPTVTEDTYSDFFDFPVINYYKLVGFDLNKEPFELLSKEYMDTYEKRKFECSIHSYFHEIQPNIKSKNIKQSILSAYAENYLFDVLNKFNILDEFTYVSGLKHIMADTKIGNGIKLINKIDIPKVNCILIGDTIHDADTADAMGIEYVLVPAGHNSLNRLKSRTNNIIRSIDDLNRIFQF